MQDGKLIATWRPVFFCTALVLSLTVAAFSQPFNPAQLADQDARIQRGLEIRYQLVDSLKQSLAHADDTTAIKRYNDLSHAMLIISNDSAWSYLLRAYAMSKSMHYYRGEALTLQSIGLYYIERHVVDTGEIYLKQAVELLKAHHFTDDLYYDAMESFGYCKFIRMEYEEARRIYFDLLDYRKQLPDNNKLAYAYRVLGKINEAQGHYEAAFNFFKKDLEISRKIKDGEGLRGSAFMNSNYFMGKMYLEAGDKDLAMNFFRRSAERALENLAPDIYDSRMADIQLILNDPDSARYYFLLARHCMSRRIPDAKFMNIVIEEINLKIANTFILQKRYNEALPLILPLLKRCSPTSLICPDIYNYLSTIYKGMNDFPQSFHYARQLSDIGRSTGSRQNILASYELLSELFEEKKFVDSALKYQKLLMVMKDSISADKQLRNIAIQEMKAWDELTKSQIDALNKERIISNQQKQGLIILLAFLALIIFILFRYNLLKRRNEKIKEQQFGQQLQVQKLETEKTKAEMQNKAIELEMQALRAQMNPHFIFNSLNSINYFILKNNKKEASEYLTKFSRLIRIILQNSQTSQIPLKDELEALKLYLDLEALRFNHHFLYTITVPNAVDVAAFKVPPLIIQPYVENAIWHGLMHKEDEGHLDIEFSVEDEELFCKISDDGVGRKKVEELKKESPGTYKSVGMRITSDRISVLGQNGISHAPVEIIDRVLSDGTPGGTTVIIKIPVTYD